MSDTKVARQQIRDTGTLRTVVACLLILFLGHGCAALHPLKGVPVSQLDDEYRGQTRAGQETIDLTLLGQPEPPEYLVDGGDVLGIYIEGLFPKTGDIPPVYYPLNNESPPAMGYPVAVREDGTITLPYLGRFSVRGMSIIQIEDHIRDLVIRSKQRQQDQLNVTVTLQKRRTYQVMVIRQEAHVAASATQSGMGTINPGEVKRGTGQIINLQAYRNDVAHALAQSGGLPGLDAENAIYILRGVGSRAPRTARPPLPPQEPFDRSASTKKTFTIRAQSPDDYPPSAGIPYPPSNRYGFSPQPPPQHSPMENGLIPPGRYGNLPPLMPTQPGSYEDPTRFDWGRIGTPPSTAQELIDNYGDGTKVIRIPIRLFVDQEVDFTPEDVILYDGDIVYIESRETEIFYTAGLLGGGQYTLPRDYDLDVLGAVSIASSRQQSNNSGGGFANRIGGIAAINQDISVSASTVIVLRQTPEGQIPIKINLYRAMRNPDERVLIQPGDYIVLQYTPIEALAAFIERNLLAGSLIGLATQQNSNN